MSATVDTNVLVYASDAGSSFHEPALRTLQTFAAGPDLVHLFWPVLMGYLRITTHPAIFRHPLSVDEAMDNVSDLLDRPPVRVVGEADGFWEVYRVVSDPVMPRGNLVPDAVVALMRQHGVTTIWTHDRDFRKFDGITVRDPFG